MIDKKFVVIYNFVSNYYYILNFLKIDSHCKPQVESYLAKRISSWCWQNLESKMYPKILLPLVIETPFIRIYDFNFFFVLKKLWSYRLIETSQSSKYYLAKDIPKPLTICIITQSKCHYWWYTRELVTELN